MSAAESAVETEGLTKDYGAGRGLFDLDLEVRRGEILGFPGPNGAGKRTAMRLLLGLALPSAGGARLRGGVPREAIGRRRERLDADPARRAVG